MKMKCENCLVSFVIPLWNRENTICYCLDSILCQALVCPFEIIVVDDASSDASNSIIKELISTDSGIRLSDSMLSDCFPETTLLFQSIDVSQEFEIRSRIRLLSFKVNQGAARARNRGLEEATGKYVWFVDSDDFISSSALKTLVRVLSLKQYDILCFSTKNYSDVPKNYLIYNDSKGLEDLDSHNVNDLLMMLRKGTVWSRVFNKKFIDDYRFNTEYSYSEDSQFVWLTTLNAHNVAYLNDSLYGYVNNKNSLTSVKPYERFKCYIQVVEEYLLAIDKTNIPQKDKKILVEECEKRLYLHAFYTYEYCEMTAEMWNKWYEVYYNVMIDNKTRGMLKRMVSRLIWGIHSDRLFVQIYNLMRKGKLYHT